MSRWDGSSRTPRRPPGAAGPRGPSRTPRKQSSWGGAVRRASLGRADGEARLLADQGALAGAAQEGAGGGAALARRVRAAAARDASPRRSAAREDRQGGQRSAVDGRVAAAAGAGQG